MAARHPLVPLVRLFYKHFYNRLALTYDTVSRVVSSGEWSSWTRAAIQFLPGPGPDPGHAPRVLEIAFGTGNLLLDLAEAGYSPVGVDLSPYMIEITRRKFKSRRLSVPILRAAAQHLPFPTGHFDHAVMTFPPGFVTDPLAMREIRRVLADVGSLIWVDAPYLYPRDTWSRFLNWAYSVTGAAPQPAAIGTLNPTRQAELAQPHAAFFDDLLPRDSWSWSVHRIELKASHVHVVVGSRLGSEKTK